MFLSIALLVFTLSKRCYAEKCSAWACGSGHANGNELQLFVTKYDITKVSQINKNIYLHLSQYLNKKSYDQKIARTYCRNVFSCHFPINTIAVFIKLRKWRDTGKPIQWSQICLRYQYIFRFIFNSFVTFDCIKESLWNEWLNFRARICLFLAKYRTLIIIE